MHREDDKKISTIFQYFKIKHENLILTYYYFKTIEALRCSFISFCCVLILYN